MQNKWFACLWGALGFLVISGPAFASGDAELGKAVFTKKCKVCHATEAGKHKNGPSLAGIIGRKAGSTDFAGYLGLKGSAVVWDAENMDAFLANPKKFVGAKTMVVKLKKEDDRNNVIEYLKTLK